MAIRSKTEQEAEQPQATCPYNYYKMLSIIKLMKKMTETQAITLPAIATQTPDGLNSSIFYC